MVHLPVGDLISERQRKEMNRVSAKASRAARFFEVLKPEAWMLNSAGHTEDTRYIE